VARLGCEIPVIPGMMPITSLPQVSRMAAFSGRPLPGHVVDRLEALADDPAGVRTAGVDIATELGDRCTLSRFESDKVRPSMSTSMRRAVAIAADATWANTCLRFGEVGKTSGMATETSSTRTQTTRRRNGAAKRSSAATKRTTGAGKRASSAAARRANGAERPAPVQINTEDIAQLEAGRVLLVTQLEEAHANELAAVTTLGAHAAMTPAGPYRRLLERHRAETREQAERLQTRLVELGATRSPLAVGYGAASAVVGQALALTKGPIDLLRGRAGEEKLFKNAKDEMVTEAAEIATYDGIEATAYAVGDVKTAELAASIREQEQATFDALRAELPTLANATVRSLAAGDASYDVSTTGAAQAARQVRDGAAGEARGQARKSQRTAKRSTAKAKSKA